MNDDISRNPEQNDHTSAEQELREEPQQARERAEQQAAPPPPPPGYAYPQYPPYPQEPARSRPGWLIPASLLIGCLPWAILFFIVIGAALGGLAGGTPGGEHVALIHVTGAITGSKSGSGPFSASVAGSESLVQQMEDVRKDESVKAVVIRINSPGGSAAGSEEIYNAVKRLRDSGKVVYASMGDVAASGGYYIAAGCDKIYANSNTLTGSIGVIFNLADLSELYEKIGYRPETIKSGKYKDIGSADRPLTTEERTILQELCDETYATFLNAVAEGRKMPLAQVKKLAEGRIYTGNQALKVKLVDKIGGLRETINAAALAGGISGEPRVIEYGEKGILDAILGSESAGASGQLSDAVRREMIRKLLQGTSELEGLR